MNSYDVVISASLSATGDSTGWVPCDIGSVMRISITGTFAATLVIDSADAEPVNRIITTYAAASGVVDFIAEHKGVYRVRSLLHTSGTAAVSIRAFDPTIILDADGKWDDLRQPASSINPTGPASPPGVDQDDGGLLFDAAGTEVVAIMVQMPHAWKQGSVIKPHVHWTKTTSASGNVYWRLEYKIANVGDIFPAEWTTLNATTANPVTADTNVADKHLITDLGSIDMSAYRASCMIKCKLSRIGGDVLDTYGADAKMLEFDIHYLIDSLGSGGELIK